MYTLNNLQPLRGLPGTAALAVMEGGAQAEAWGYIQARLAAGAGVQVYQAPLQQVCLREGWRGCSLPEMGKPGSRPTQQCVQGKRRHVIAFVGCSQGQARGLAGHSCSRTARGYEAGQAGNVRKGTGPQYSAACAQLTCGQSMGTPATALTPVCQRARATHELN